MEIAGNGTGIGLGLGRGRRCCCTRMYEPPITARKMRIGVGVPGAELLSHPENPTGDISRLDSLKTENDGEGKGGISGVESTMMAGMSEKK